MTAEIWLAVLGGALVGGFVNGFAGFGTALVVSGLWFALLPTEVVPPLIILCAVTGQLVSLWRLSGHLSWAKALPLISGGLPGVPLGTLIVVAVSPDGLKLLIGGFLVVYTLWSFIAGHSIPQITPRSRLGDRVVGFCGGVLGGIAGLAGPVPIVWLQLQRLAPSEQRARYQPFNLTILLLSAVSMAMFGQITNDVLLLMAIALPATVAGVYLGLNTYRAVSDAAFRRAVLMLLLLSGLMILAQTLS